MQQVVESKPRKRGTQTVTISDVARHVGVAPITVSCVLNGTGRISENTRATVRRAMEELGYEPNVNARRLAGARDERTIALLLPRLDFDVTLRKVAILQKLLSQQGYSVPLHAFGALACPDETELKVLARELRRQKPRAIVCTYDILPTDAREEVRRYQQEGGLVVTFNAYADLECDQIAFDREHNNYVSARHLLELGHRNIGMWMTYGGDIFKTSRFRGFEKACQEFDVTVRPEWCWSVRDDTCNEDQGAALALQLLQMTERPTGMCIVNDSAAQACVAELQRGGLRVPEDISIVSHDDLPIARRGAVPMTAVSHPIQEMAEAIVEVLLRRIENHDEGPPQRVALQGQLQVRQSTAPPKN